MNQHQEPKVSRAYWVVMVACVLLIVGVTAVGYGKWWGVPPIPVIKPMQDFTMQTAEGTSYQFQASNGKVRLVSFIFTRCPDVCPVTTQYMAQMQTDLQAKGLFGSQVEFITVSFDDEFDKPAVLKEYASTFNAHLAGWKFLVGDPETTKQVLRDFGIGAEKQPNEQYLHTMRTFLVDKNGNMRKMYGMAADMNLEEITRDMQALVKE